MTNFKHGDIVKFTGYSFNSCSFIGLNEEIVYLSSLPLSTKYRLNIAPGLAHLTPLTSDYVYGEASSLPPSYLSKYIELAVRPLLRRRHGI